MKNGKAIENIKSELSNYVLEDTDTHHHRFHVCSESSDRLYLVSQAVSSGEWQCGCPDWIFRHGKQKNYLCKHLRAIHPALKKIDQLQLG